MIDTIINPPLTTSIEQALRFGQVKDDKLIQSIHSIIPTLPADKDGMIIHTNSPLDANIIATLEGDRIIINVNITNHRNYAWFMNKDDNLNVFLKEGERIYSFTNSDFTLPSDGRDVFRLITDNDFLLIRPNETLTFQQVLSAEDLYQNWRGQDIFISYTTDGPPPSIFKFFLALYNQRKIDRVYEDRLFSNRVRVRCYDYDKNSDRYQCDINNDDHTVF